MTEATKRLDVIYLASHGFAVRMLIQTDLLSKLKGLGLSVGIVTTDASDPSLIEYCKNNGIENIGYSETKFKWQHNIDLFRRYLLEDVKNNPALYEKHLRMLDQKDSSKSVRQRIRLANFAEKISKLLPFTKSLYSRIENYLMKSEEAELLIKNYAPKVLISTIPVSVIESQLLYAASKTNTITVTQILSWDNITCKGRFRMLSDYYIVWGTIMKNELKRFYNIPEDRIFSCGVPHFDLHFRNRENPSKGNPSQKYLVFAMSAPYFAPKEIDVVETLAKLVTSQKWPGLELVVRPHPQNVSGNMADLTWIQRLDKLQSAHVRIDYPHINTNSGIKWSMKQSDMVEMSELIGGSVAVLNSCSTMTIDGLCYLKPTIVTAFDNEEELPWHISVKRVMEYEHFRNIVQSGAVAVTWNYRELENAITQAIENPSEKLEEMKSILNAEVGVDDGHATDRVVEVLYRLCVN